MQRLALAIALIASFLVGCSESKTKQVDAAWYDPKPLTDGLKAGVADDAMKTLKLQRFEDLILYNLDMIVSEDLRSFELVENVWFTNRGEDSLDELVFRVFANARTKTGPVQLVSAECVGQPCAVGWDRRGVLSIKPAASVKTGERLRLKLSFKGTLAIIDAERTQMMSQAFEGMSRSTSKEAAGDYGMVAFSNGIAAFGEFFAVLASRRAGQWVREDPTAMGDLSGDPSIINVKANIRLPAGAMLASSGSVLKEHTVIDDNGRVSYTEVEVAAPLVRNFGMIVSRNFVVKSRNVGGVQVRSFALSGHQDKSEVVLTTAADSLKVFEKRFGAYPYKELDLAEAPLVGGAGGVEFSGFVTIASMFYQPPAGGAIGKLIGSGKSFNATITPMLRFVTAHEVAHQWWHGLVGSDSREHPYVDEPLAQLSALLYIEDTFGEKQADLETKRQVVSNYHMMRANGREDQIVAQSVESFPDELSYAGTIYGKAPMFYQTVREKLGDTAFNQALRRYASKHAFGVAGPEALFEELNRGHEQELKPVIARWIHEQHGDEDLGTPKVEEILGNWTGDKMLEGILKSFQGTLNDFGLGDSDTPLGGRLPRDSSPDVGDLETRRAIKEVQDAFKSAEGLMKEAVRDSKAR